MLPLGLERYIAAIKIVSQHQDISLHTCQYQTRSNNPGNKNIYENADYFGFVVPAQMGIQSGLALGFRILGYDKLIRNL